VILLFSPILVMLASTPPGRVFGLDWQAVFGILIQLLNVSLLAYVLTKLVYKPVQKFMQGRSDRIGSQIETNEKELARAEQLKLEYEQKLRGIDQERDAILDEARRVATENGRLLMAEAKKEAEAIRQRAQENVKLEEERAQAKMKIAIIEVSAAMSAKFVARAIDRDAQDKLFDETMAELEEMAWRS